jgi:tetratricopeptide (TPR) repeat protein
LSYTGQTEEAIRRAQRALSLSPLDPFRFRHEHFLSIALFSGDQFTDAADWGLRCHERNPNYTSNLRVTIAALIAAGLKDKARLLANQLMTMQPNLRAGESAQRMPFYGEAKREIYKIGLIQAGIPE